MSHSGASEKASKGSGCCSFLTLQGVGAQGSTDSQGKASETALSQLRIISLDVNASVFMFLGMPWDPVLSVPCCHKGIWREGVGALEKQGGSRRAFGEGSLECEISP